MVKDEKQDVDIDQIQKILDDLVSKGEVFASCSHCEQYLSYNEKELLFCNNCKNKLSKDQILYLYNKASGQNN